MVRGEQGPLRRRGPGPALAFIEDVGDADARHQPPHRRRRPHRPAAPSSASTATRGSRRTRRRTRPTDGIQFGTRARARSTRPASTYTWGPGACSWPAASGIRSGTRCTRSARRSPPKPKRWTRDHRRAVAAVPARRRVPEASAGGLRPRSPADRGAQAQGLHGDRGHEREATPWRAGSSTSSSAAVRRPMTSCGSSVMRRGWRTDSRVDVLANNAGASDQSRRSYPPFAGSFLNLKRCPTASSRRAAAPHPVRRGRRTKDSLKGSAMPRTGDGARHALNRVLRERRAAEQVEEQRPAARAEAPPASSEALRTLTASSNAWPRCVIPISRLTFSIPGASGCVSTIAEEASSSHAMSPPRGVTVRLSGESSSVAELDSYTSMSVPPPCRSGR